MPLDLIDDESTLVQVMAWWRQATSHYLSQCWPRSMSPNGVTRPQWVNYNGEHTAITKDKIFLVVAIILEMQVSFYFLDKKWFWFIIHWSLFWRVSLKIGQHWFRLCPCSGMEASHYLNQYWSRSMIPWGHDELLTQPEILHLKNALDRFQLITGYHQSCSPTWPPFY